jgi:DNA-binding XRE family transcriptional regulator
MADSAQLAHSGHTELDHAAALDVATGFQELIDEHRKLRDDYATLLAQFPGPIPDSQPAVNWQGEDGTVRLVAVEVTAGGLRPLPEPEEARLAEGEARRCSLLAVHQPFVRVYWRPDAAGPAHKAVNEWRAGFYVVMKRLRRLYRTLKRNAQLPLDREAQLHDFPLLRADGATCGISGVDVLEAIQTHIEHLADDLSSLEPKAPRESDGIGARLRAARKHKGDTQQNVADALKCHVTTISRIERGNQCPDWYKSQIEDYILKASK